MPLILVPDFLAITDKLASQYRDIQQLATALPSVAGYTFFTVVTDTDDADVELPMIKAAHDADVSISGDLMIRSSGLNCLLGMISSFDGHFSMVGFVGGTDQYCTLNDIRVSDYYNKMYALAKGQYLYANNVFCENDSLFGTIDIQAGPVIHFVDGVNYGNGAIANRRATNGNYAATQLRLVVTVFNGATQCDLKITGTDKVGNLQSVTVVVPAGTLPGTVIPVGATTDRFLDVGSVSFPTANTGTVGDTFEIRNIKERIMP